MALPEVWWPSALTADPAPKKGTSKAKRAKVQRIACPPLSAADKAALAAVTPRPAHWGPEPATRGELQAHVDALEHAEATKRAAAQRIIAEHERCRGGRTRRKGKAKTS
jgi:hypothetical protein